MDEPRRRRAEELFQLAADLPREKRGAFLGEHCEADAGLRSEVESLLSHWEAGDGSFLERPALADRQVSSSAVPEQMGRYRVMRLIGEGGMGAVYEATQEHPRRTVALKVMRRGMASPGLLRRFEYESQILARLRHPNIAQVFDAGVHDEAGPGAVPYFVMEYLPDACPITEYAEAKRLGMRARLELFAMVCDAVHHGHQRGIIHRDLKPSNILVDAGGLLKVIDFGVARATDSDLAVTTVQTEVGQLIGTLQYMSPEQVDGDPHDLDVRSDVYALGLVLYELLCGRAPYDTRGTGVFEALRLIREHVPARPSTLDRSLRGDLDWIVAKCLEKDRTRRYASANGLATDIRHFLRHEPVMAGPPGAFYRFQKFVRRNPTSVAAATLLVCGLGAFSLYASVQAGRFKEQAELAQIERAKAEQIAQLLEDTLKHARASVELGRDATILKEMMDRTARDIEAGRLKSAPEAELRIRLTISDVYQQIMAHDAAGRMLLKAIQLAESIHGRESEAYAGVTVRHASWLGASRRYDEALARYNEALAIRRRLYPGDHPLVAQSLHDLADQLHEQARHDESRGIAREALAMRRRLYPGDHSDIAASLITLAWCSQEARDAMPLMTDALAMLRRLHSGDHPEVAWSLRHVGYAFIYLGRPAEALPLLQESLDMRRRLFPDGDPSLMSNLNGLRECYNSLGRHSEQLAVSQEMLAIAQRFHPEGHQMIAWGLDVVASSLDYLGRSAEALPVFEESLAIRRKRFHPNHFILSTSLNGYGNCLVSLGRAEEAVSVFEEALRIRAVTSRAEDPVLHGYSCGLARAYAALGRYEEAETILTQAWQTLLDGEMPPLTLTFRVCAAAFIEFYDARHAAEPEMGFDGSAAAWRETLSVFEANVNLPVEEIRMALRAAE